MGLVLPRHWTPVSPGFGVSGWVCVLLLGAGRQFLVVLSVVGGVFLWLRWRWTPLGGLGCLPGECCRVLECVRV